MLQLRSDNCCCYILKPVSYTHLDVYKRQELANPKEHTKIRNLLSLKILVFKILSSLALIIGGGAIGREGPTIQIAGSVFRKVNEYLPDWWPKISKKNMIMTGAAAGPVSYTHLPHCLLVEYARCQAAGRGRRTQKCIAPG